MFSFFKRKKPSDDKVADKAQTSGTEQEQQDQEPDASGSELRPLKDEGDAVATQHPATPDVAVPDDSATAVPRDTTDTAGTARALAPTAVEPVEVDPAAAEPTVDDPATVDAAAADPDSAKSATDSAAAQPAEKPIEDVAEEAAEKPAEKSGGSWLARLRKGLSRTGQSIGGLFVDVQLDEALYEELETALIMADAGMEATEKLLTALRARVRKQRLTEAAQARAALRELLAEHLKPLEKQFPIGRVKPLVMMIAGVNGAGKTTSIGKLANTFQAGGAHVLLAAGDTFRAAAREQLMEWGARNNVTVIAQEGGDPAAVAFDAVNAGRARKADVVMIDTAGRLPTQLHLMEELKKIKRVVTKADGDAPHEVLLVVDGNSGQNVLAQIRAFDAAIGLTGLVVTKLDGTAKGGTLAAVAAGTQGVRPVPVYWIGVGEGIHDLQPFVAREFAAALIGD